MTKVILRNDPAKKRRETKLCDGYCGNVYEISTMFADLDGEPLRSYYCDTCADEIETELYYNKVELLNKGSI